MIMKMPVESRRASTCVGGGGGGRHEGWISLPAKPLNVGLDLPTERWLYGVPAHTGWVEKTMGRRPDATEKTVESRLVYFELVGRSRRSHDAGVAKQKRSVGRTKRCYHALAVGATEDNGRIMTSLAAENKTYSVGRFTCDDRWARVDGAGAMAPIGLVDQWDGRIRPQVRQEHGGTVQEKVGGSVGQHKNEGCCGKHRVIVNGGEQCHKLVVKRVLHTRYHVVFYCPRKRGTRDDGTQHGPAEIHIADDSGDAGRQRKNRIGKCVANGEREKKGGACDQKTPLNSRKTILRRINKKKMTPNHYVGIVDEEPSIELYATLIFLS